MPPPSSPAAAGRISGTASALGGPGAPEPACQLDREGAHHFGLHRNAFRRAEVLQHLPFGQPERPGCLQHATQLSRIKLLGFTSDALKPEFSFDGVAQSLSSGCQNSNASKQGDKAVRRYTA